MRFKPIPVQKPRIPIWVAATWPSQPPVRRAARWDGVAPLFYSTEENEYVEPTPELVRDLAEYAALHRAPGSPLDIAVPADIGRISEFAEAGVTWCRHGWFPELGIEPEDWLATVLDGPPVS